MKVIIFGLGSIAKKHISALQLMDESVRIFAFRQEHTTVEVLDVKNIFSIEDVKTINPNFIIISNPTFAHYKTIESLIPLNIPLFIEKPLFSVLDDGKLVAQILDQNLVTYVACNLRFLESLQFIQKYLADKRVNEVNMYCGSYLPDWRPNRDYKTTYSANKNEGGGVHIDLIHEIDYAYWLFGKPLKVNKTFTNKSTLDINAWDYANYIFEYDQFSASIILNYYRRDPKRTLEIILENETITVDILKNSVYRNDDIIFCSPKTIQDTYSDQIRFFVDQIITKKKSFNNVNEAYKILEICLQDA